MQHVLVNARTYRYELVALFTGASVMMLEVIGARLIAPYFGTSIYVWTAIIGVILGSLALGFWYGGKLADKKGSSQTLGPIIIAAALLLLLTALSHVMLLEAIASFGLDVRISALMSAVVLFGLPSALIGAVSPNLAKLRVTSLKTTGQSVGRLEAAGAIGSIAGTFLCGYVLLGWFGSRDLMLALSILLIAVSFLAETRHLRFGQLLLAIVAAVCLFLPSFSGSGVISDTDSAYNRYLVREVLYSGGPARVLQTDYASYQSGVFVTGLSRPLPFNYANTVLEVADKLKPTNVLVLGGGAYVIPGVMAQQRPDIKIDLVEIDPALDELAKRYFFYEPSSAINIFHEDGRTFLNRASSSVYDLIFVDAYSALNPPFQLATSQAIGHMKRSLTSDGVVLANVVSRYEQGQNDYLQALRQTYKTAFSEVGVYRINQKLPHGNRQNFLLTATNNQTAHHQINESLKTNQLTILPGGIVMTDDFTPIERLTF